MFLDEYQSYVINKNNVFSGDYRFPLGGFEFLRLRL